MSQHGSFIRRFLKVGFFFGILIALFSNSALGQELDPSLAPSEASIQDLQDTYNDMGVVQRRAKKKAGKYLFSTFGTVDFSAGPRALHSFSTNVGYALSDYFELYASLTPVFITVDREITRQIAAFKLENGKQAKLEGADPRLQYGVEALWAPAYGKDSWGPNTLIRSDTFLRFFAGQLMYETDTGLRFSVSLGKTFFVSNWFNVRIAAGASYLEEIVNSTKTFVTVGFIDSGLVWYF
jgi:hypothetical protein